MAGVRRVLLDPTKQARRVENASKALVRWAQHNLRAGLFSPWAEQRQSVQPGVTINAKGISIASPDANTRLMVREQARKLAQIHSTNFGDFMVAGNYAIFFSDAPEEFTGKASASAMLANRANSPIRHDHASHSFGADEIIDLLNPTGAADRVTDRRIAQQADELGARRNLERLPETYSERDAAIEARFAPVRDTRVDDLEALDEFAQRDAARGLVAVGAASGEKKPFFKGIADAFRRKPEGLKREISRLEARIEVLRKKLDALEPAASDGVGTVGFLNAFVGEITDTLDAVQPIIFICRQQLASDPASAEQITPQIAEASQAVDAMESAVDAAIQTAEADDADPDLDDNLTDPAASAAAVPGATMGVGAVPQQSPAARAAAFRAFALRAAAARRQQQARQQQARRIMMARRAAVMRAMVARRRQQQAAFAGAGAGAGAGYGASMASPGGGDMGAGGGSFGGGSPMPSYTPMPAGDTSAADPYVNPAFTDPGFGFDAPISPIVADPYGAESADPLAADPVLTDPTLDPALSLGVGTLGFMNTFEYAEGVGAVSAGNGEVVQTIATFESMTDDDIDQLIETHLEWLRLSRSPEDAGRRAVSRALIAVARATKGDFLRTEDGLRLVRNYVAALAAYKDGTIMTEGVGDIDHLIPPPGHNPYGTGLGRQYEGGYGNEANPLLLGAIEGTVSRHLTRDARREAPEAPMLLSRLFGDPAAKKINSEIAAEAGISEAEADALLRVGDSAVKWLNQAGIKARRPGANTMSRHLTRDARRVMQRAASEGIEIGGIGDFGDFDTINRFTGAFIDAPAYTPDDEFVPQTPYIQYPVMGGFLEELANDDGPTRFGEPVGIGDINNLRTVNDLYRYRVEPPVVGDINFVPAIRQEDRVRPMKPALFNIDYPFGG